MTCEAPSIGWTAVVLAGGRGSRLGNVDKASLTIGGTSALDHLLSSIPEGVPVVVAGPPHRTERLVTFRQERPLYGGPVAGIGFALETVSTPVTALLAVDMPWAGGLVRRLIAELPSTDAAALVPVDRSGHRQTLCSVVRTDALRRALTELGNPQGRSLRDLFSLIKVQERTLRDAETHWVDDIDTPEDLRRSRSTPPPSRVMTYLPPTERGAFPESVVVSDRAVVPEEGVKPMMKAWIDAVRKELSLPAEVDIDVILDVARVAARNIERPAAPVTTFLLGIAVAGGTDVNEAAAKIQELAAAWPTPTPTPTQ